jgi:sarcosine oxidase subunit beta
VETERGFIGAKKIGVSAAGNTSVVMNMADLQFPLESYPLQALVSEPVKPIVPCVVMSNTVHAYISQSDKGELVIGAGTDQYTSYSQRGAPHHRAHAGRDLRDLPDLHPHAHAAQLGRDRRRHARSLADPGQDAGAGLYVNCGWGTGGFKATPGAADLLAHTIAHDAPHAINAPFTLDRFRNGRMIDEAAAAAVALTERAGTKPCC